ncbi:hypothetical protein [Agrobacterium sp. M50-1]|uniref:hypothetical protein n=1 Tax=Agrobacterium sp. M50-1 TaxID=3132821 RepID=UPI003CE49556
MNSLEMIGAASIYIWSVILLCAVSVVIGSRIGAGKGPEALTYVIYPPIAIAAIGLIAGLILLGKVLI